MAILTRVSTAVRTISAANGELTVVTSGEIGEAGQSYYIASDNKAYLTDANSTDEFDGYLLGNVGVDEKVAAQTGGVIYLGSDATQGMLYCTSPTKGETEEATSSLISGNITTCHGYGDANGNVVMTKIETEQLIPT